MPSWLKKLTSWLRPDYRIPQALLSTGGWFYSPGSSMLDRDTTYPFTPIPLSRWIDLPHSTVRARCLALRWGTPHPRFILRWEKEGTHRIRKILITPRHPLHPLAIQLFADYLPNLTGDSGEELGEEEETTWGEQLLEVLTK